MLGDEYTEDVELQRLKKGQLKPYEIKRLEIINRSVNDICILLQDYAHQNNKADQALRCFIEGMRHLYRELDNHPPVKENL